MKHNPSRLILSCFLTISMLLSLAGCSSHGGAQSVTKAEEDSLPGLNSPIETDGVCVDLMADVQSSFSPEIDALSEPVKAMLAAFSMRLLYASHTEGESILVSPLSVLSALSMTSNGAKGETLREMETLLGMPVDEINNCMAWYLTHLPENDKCHLLPANSIWFTNEHSFTPNQSFLETNAAYYGADAYSLPFDNEACQIINEWCNEKTEGMIPELIDEIPPETVMYLINALAFEAEWQVPYHANQVREDVFTREDGTMEQHQFLSANEGIYLCDTQATGFIKYYRDGQYAFVALLPKEGIKLNDYLASLDGESFRNLLDSREETTVRTLIPKFEISCGLELSKTLSDMGMPLAFDPELADLSGLGTADGNLFINRVLQKTYIALTEQGTIAGAGTAVEVNTRGVHMVQKEVLLNRPFVFFLIDCETNLPFFAGTVEQLSE